MPLAKGTIPSAVFFTAIRRQIWQIFDPSSLKNADVLNGWSQRGKYQYQNKAMKNDFIALYQITLDLSNILSFYCIGSAHDGVLK